MKILSLWECTETGSSLYLRGNVKWHNYFAKSGSVSTHWSSTSQRRYMYPNGYLDQITCVQLFILTLCLINKKRSVHHEKNGKSSCAITIKPGISFFFFLNRVFLSIKIKPNYWRDQLRLNLETEWKNREKSQHTASFIHMKCKNKQG